MARRGRAGFTLVEVLVATVVLATGLLAGLAAFSIANRSSGASRNDTVVPMLAERKLSEVAATPRDDLVAGTSKGDFGEEFPTYTYDLKVSPEDDLHVVRVELVIHAKEMGGTRNVTYATALF